MGSEKGSMIYEHLKGSAALGALAIALLATALPAQAQDRGERGSRGDRGSWSQRDDARTSRAGNRGEWRQRGEARAERTTRPAARFDTRPVRTETAPPAARVDRLPGAPRVETKRDYGTRNGAPRSYGADRQRGNYGATTRAERREDARESRQDFRQGYRSGRAADNRDDRQVYRQGYRAGQQQERREDWRDDRRDRQRAYAQGYRAGDRSDDWRSGRYGQDYRRWDNRGWRNDRRYDWYRYRAANRALYSPGRYYAPYRGYNYSRISIGFRLASLFYSNRYWINDPWQYRLPAAYGPYRWIRYYDDALLVDIYSGEVVDVIDGFFW